DIVRQGLDQRLPDLQKAKPSAVRPIRGWLRAVREATGIRQDSVAKRMGIRRQTYARLEVTESLGSISLGSLQKAADAMDCEVVYFLLPKSAVAENYAALAKRHDAAFHHLQAAEHSMALEDQAVGDLKPKP
ncbi:MAG: helix-turn-helix domain-containing protein, partial [Verrucomicrobia bacterium]|nr:helix-turn-helix domain-containing protein [Verrucomicrobiota bacterium]